jgi:hypothetical protein
MVMGRSLHRRLPLALHTGASLGIGAPALDEQHDLEGNQMSVTEYERKQLFTWFEEHMGKERAEALMSLLPPVGWADVATKRDLDTLAERLETRFDARLHELRADLQRTVVTWMLAAQATVIAALGLLVTVTR